MMLQASVIGLWQTTADELGTACQLRCPFSILSGGPTRCTSDCEFFVVGQGKHVQLGKIHGCHLQHFQRFPELGGTQLTHLDQTYSNVSFLIWLPKRVIWFPEMVIPNEGFHISIRRYMINHPYLAIPPTWESV